MLADLRSSPALHSLLADAFGSAGAGGDEDPPADAWWLRVVAVGRGAGAVRTDLPAPLVAAMAHALTSAMDRWLLAQPAESDTSALVPTLVAAVRAALAPDSPAPGEPAGRPPAPADPHRHT